MLLNHSVMFINGAFVSGLSLRAMEGRIAQISASLEPYENEPVLDLGGDYLLPGCVDIHTHAFGGQDTMQGEEAVRHMSRELYKIGVAAFLPTTMSASIPDTLSAVEGIANVVDRPEIQGAIVAGAHMEAPFLNSAKKGAQKAEYFLAPSLAHWASLTGSKASYVKIMTLAPELPGAQGFIEHITRQGVHISIGHTQADAAAVHQAATWGADHVTHTFNAQTPLLHREPGVPGAALTDDRLYCEFIADGIHLHPDILKIGAAVKGSGRMILVTDAMEATGMPDGTYALGGQTVYVRDGAARLQDGTLAGSTLTLPRAIHNMIRFGIAPEKVIPMATSTPADSIGRPDLGRITPGAPLPLTRWNEAWEMTQVIV